MTQASGPQPPVNERLAEIALKVISAGSITAGGAGAFWQLFQQEDIPKAIAASIRLPLMPLCFCPTISTAF